MTAHAGLRCLVHQELGNYCDTPTSFVHKAKVASIGSCPPTRERGTEIYRVFRETKRVAAVFWAASSSHLFSRHGHGWLRKGAPFVLR